MLITLNSYINFDVLDNSIVNGNPEKIVKIYYLDGIFKILFIIDNKLLFLIVKLYACFIIFIYYLICC